MNNLFQQALRSFGKGPGFVAFAFFSALGLFALSYLGKDVAALTGPLGVLAGGLYAGGAWKAAAEAKNGVSHPPVN